jgi:hypothetical protein
LGFCFDVFEIRQALEIGTQMRRAELVLENGNTKVLSLIGALQSI